MIITLKKIMNLINSPNAPIYYYQYQGGKYESIVYLKTISNEKQVEYNRLAEDEQKSYVSDSAEIYIPLISVDFLAQIYKASFSHDYPYTLKKVHNMVHVIQKDESTAVALYMLLHELGHWVDFLRCGRKPYDFTMPDSVEARRVHNYGNQLQVKLSAKKSLSEEDHIELENFIQQYYKIPFEKRANDYADLHYREAYEILKEHGFLE